LEVNTLIDLLKKKLSGQVPDKRLDQEQSPNNEEEQDSMDTEYRNKLLQVSYGDKKKQEENSLDTPDKRRGATRRLLQRLQEGPVPDMNTDKEVVEDEGSNAIARQVAALDEEEQVPVPARRKSRPALP
jgi:hypothetical protein